jgi:hypothetical protein
VSSAEPRVFSAELICLAGLYALGPAILMANSLRSTRGAEEALIAIEARLGWVAGTVAQAARSIPQAGWPIDHATRESRAAREETQVRANGASHTYICCGEEGCGMAALSLAMATKREMWGPR